ncbi:MAG TPA: S8/S53 family peptidase [Thermoanaerobaculia bacterium]|nr:S8/S53 family peptidase [Thermoanaerobaculia bacterium]
MHRRPPVLAVLDVGFTKHPDLPARRVLAARDATGASLTSFRYGDPATFAEHGTRTMLLAAGDGRSSHLPSLAPEAPVVLVKVGAGHRVPRRAIVRAFEWLLREGPELGVRVVLCPFGDDPETPGDPSAVPDLVRALDAGGVVLLAAAGWDPESHCVSPASSPFALGVGGWDLARDEPAAGPRFERVHGVPKPDLLAPSTPLRVPALDAGRSPETAGGTSFAASLVAGAALRLLGEDPSLTREAILRRLLAEAREVPGHPPYLDRAGLRRAAGAS